MQKMLENWTWMFFFSEEYLAVSVSDKQGTQEQPSQNSPGSFR